MPVTNSYFKKAVDAFLDNELLVIGQPFDIYDTKKDFNKPASVIFIGNAFINANYDLVVDGVARNDLFRFLLDGVYFIDLSLSDKRVRGFELISGAEGARLPERGTEHSAGYDFFAREDFKILPHTTKTAWTGVKAYMPPDEVLLVYNRSSNARNKGLMLSNGVGVVDSDYYNNPANEGDIGFDFYNIRDEIVIIKKGEKLGQAIFSKFAVADNDIHGGKRVGGFGSTGK